ncbi:hypothetical protein GCM10010124_08160 [Pilimelia terevasa]|uniref:Chemotaxis phosphatase CheX-like domain-containing protein n=1 Tax=Pilimelia terevasa TaxID=53372 RepID=A0A8J3BFM8_9ACTN|nr:chemotaxis protein CheX [Pilimelia terevasa]GGK17986.1 hypothetical protein GCM10010124_08160 [Pilimelia terevasa]
MSGIADSTLEPSDIDLKEIVDQVWESYLDPDGTAPLVLTGTVPEKFDATGSISITGPWHGHVVVATSLGAATGAAAAFLAMEPDEVSEEDVADALGELVNIIGGNVKSMLPPGCLLALPHVVVATGAVSRWPGATRICELCGQWRGEPVCISLWHEKREG